MIIHSYRNYSGGIADFLRSVYAYYIHCKNNNVEYHIHFFDHPFKHIFEDQHINPSVQQFLFEDLGGTRSAKTDLFLNGAFKSLVGSEAANGATGPVYIIIGNVMDFVSYKDLSTHRESFLNFLNFSDAVKERAMQIIKDTVGLDGHEPRPFNIIHVRCGDKYIPNGHITSDVRVNDTGDYKIAKAITFLGHMGPVVLLTDNNDIRKRFGSPNNGIHVPNTIITHTAVSNNVDDIIDAFAEFYLVKYCMSILSVYRSGFSFMSSFLFDKDYYTFDSFGEIGLYVDEARFVKYFTDGREEHVLKNML